MADIVTITMAVPIFSGIWPTTTTNGCLAGLATGMLTIMCWGWLEFGYFGAGFRMITMMCFGGDRLPPSGNGAPGCGFYANRAVLLFPAIVITSAFATFYVSGN